MIPAWIWGIAGFSAYIMQEIAKPRLPVYSMKMLPSFPKLRWDGNGLGAGLKTSLQAEISFHNDNFVDIHVYALAFDVFYMNWDGELQHVGHLQDRIQVENNAARSGSISGNSSSSKQAERNVSPSISSSEKQKQAKQKQQQDRKKSSKKRQQPPLWRISKRSDFSIVDELYMFLDKTWKMLSNSRFWSSLWHGSGVVLIPTTGVAMVKAQPGGTPLTLQLVCDNILDTWSLYITGVECTLQQLQPGWSNMTDTILRLRQYALSNLRANSTGGVLQHAHMPTRKDILYNVAWDEAVHVVS
jgi:hypothetical protein